MPFRFSAVVLALMSSTALLAPAALAQDTGVTMTDRTAAAANTAAAPVAVTRVTLATGGLAHVEGRMTAPGETMRLAIERPQVADVLRTLVVSGDQPVVSIDLPAAEPVGERSPAGRLLAGDLANPATVLEALVGEDVVLRGGATQLAGRLLSFAPVDLPPPPRNANEAPAPWNPGFRVAVATPDGRVQFATFPALDQLAIEGPAVAERMAAVLPALAETVDDGRRDLTVRLAGPTEAGFSFVVPTTVWRPSYRAMIGADGDVTLEGWGTLENTTGLDWNDIDLRLSVGTPVAYAQDVYAPLRTTRPTAPFEVGRTVETDVVESAAAMEFDTDAAMAPAPAPMAAMRQRFAGAVPGGSVAKSAGVVTGDAAVAGTAATIFNVAGKIDLAAGRTLTVPFLSGTETVDRIVYLDLAEGRQPMDALELTFDAAATVPGGLVAVYDEAGFVGDARFGGADGGDTTILPFAVTADVDATTQDRTASTLASARLANGSLQVTRNQVTRTAVRVAAKAETILVADVARMSGDTVEAAASGGEAVAVATLDTGRARLRTTLPAGTHTVTVTTTRPVTEYYAVSDIPTPILEEVLAEGGTVDAATKARLTELAAVARRVAEIGARIGTIEADVADLREAVANDRENLEAIDVRTPEGAEVRQRIVARSNRIDEALGELRSLRRELETEQNRLR